MRRSIRRGVLIMLTSNNVVVRKKGENIIKKEIIMKVVTIKRGVVNLYGDSDGCIV